MAKKQKEDRYVIKFNEKLGKHLLVRRNLGSNVDVFVIEETNHNSTGIKLVKFI